MICIPKGTKDVLPQDSYKWNYVEHRIRKICKLYNIREIRTPVFEHTELFTRSIGDGTDVVSKEMYTFLDKGKRSITLKPEGTAGVARSYVENSLDALSLPLKLFYLTPVYRYEQPQAGRLREHHQFGIELYGSPSPYMDFEALSVAYNFLKELGIIDVSLNLNSIGCNNCRPKYIEALKSYLQPNADKLCPTCRERLERNTLRVLDCKVDACKEIVANAPKTIDYLCEDCASHMEKLVKCLDKAKIDYHIDTSIVRGLDYYTKTVFEFVTNMLGSQGTVCGGGRYDNLVESVGGKPTPCVGFGMGLERLILLLDKTGLMAEADDNVTVFVAYQDGAYQPLTMELTSLLRSKGIRADTEFGERSLKSQLKYASKIGAKYVIVIGQSEAESGLYQLKNMSLSTAENLTQEEIITKLS